MRAAATLSATNHKHPQNQSLPPENGVPPRKYSRTLLLLFAPPRADACGAHSVNAGHEGR
jgi:hypothetical protein